MKRSGYGCCRVGHKGRCHRRSSTFGSDACWVWYISPPSGIANAGRSSSASGMLWNGKSYGWCWGIYRARSIPIGVVSDLRRNTPLGVVLRAASLIGLSIPVFYVGVLLLIALSLYRRDYPIVQAAVTAFTLAVLRVNLIVDVLNSWIDRGRAR